MKDETTREAIRTLIHHHLVFDKKKNTPSVEQIAERLRVQPINIYKIIEGSIALRLEMLPSFYHASGQPIELLRWLVTKCDPALALINIKETKDVNGSFDDEKDDLVIHVGKLHEELNKALSDNHLDDDEKTKIRQRVTQIITVCERFLHETEKSK